MDSGKESSPALGERLMRRWQDWALRSVLVGSGLMASLVVAEITLRMFHLAPVGGLATVSQREFERVPGLFHPRQRLVDRTIPALPHLTTIDSLGYRGTRAFPRERPVGELRILMLGDSFTFGSYVDDNESLPAQLESFLLDRCTAVIRVINAGVGGSTINSANEMAGRALPLGIDVGVLTFTENDVSDLINPMWGNLARNRAAKSQFPMSFFYPMARNLALWNLLLQARARLVTMRTKKSAVRAAAGSSTPAGDEDTLRAQYTRRLRELRNRMDGAGIVLVFGVFPSHRSLAKDTPGSIVQWAEHIGREAGLPTVNYLAALRSTPGPTESLYLLPHDGHPSAKGYRVVAEMLADSLLALPTVARHCGPNLGLSPVPNSRKP